MKKFSKFFGVLLGMTLAFILAGCDTPNINTPTYYSVKFETNGGSMVKSQTVESGKTAIEPKDPTKDATATVTYTFAGWYSNSELTSAFDFATSIKKDITLYAKWTENAITYTVTFEANGGSTVKSQTVESGKTAIEPKDPTKDATATVTYTFAGWYSNSELTSAFDFATSIKKDITLYAKWIIEIIGTPYTELPRGTGGSAGTDAIYVNFGDWPQTIKADDVTVDVTKSVIQGLYTYYKGSDDAWYAEYGRQYYKVEPIKWRVLDSGKKLLLAENILINCMYYDYDNVNRTVSDVTVYPNNYEHSKVRAYLNGLSYIKKSSDEAEQETDSTYTNKGFLQTAFTSTLQKSIATTTVDNSAASTTDNGNNLDQVTTYACNNTNDKIFLLSEKEVTTTDYGFAAYSAYGPGNTRIRVTTDFAKANEPWQSVVVCWWLRSPVYYTYNNSYYARFVRDDGSAYYPWYVEADDMGVVPALCLN